MTGGEIMLSILIAEKDNTLRQAMKAALAGSYDIHEADNGIEAIEISNREPISIYLINCEMPFVSERDFLTRFERLTVRPILVYGPKQDCTMAEQYPFVEFFEKTDDIDLIRRKVDTMRYNHFGTSQDPRYFRLQGLEIDYFQKRLSIDGKEVRMTPKEYELLVFLITHTGTYYTRETLLEQVWGYEFLGDSRTVDTHIKSVRNKLGPYRNIVITIWGKGYRIELPQVDNPNNHQGS